MRLFGKKEKKVEEPYVPLTQEEKRELDLMDKELKTLEQMKEKSYALSNFYSRVILMPETLTQFCLLMHEEPPDAISTARHDRSVWDNIAKQTYEDERKIKDSPRYKELNTRRDEIHWRGRN